MQICGSHADSKALVLLALFGTTRSRALIQSNFSKLLRRLIWTLVLQSSMVPELRVFQPGGYGLQPVHKPSKIIRPLGPWGTFFIPFPQLSRPQPAAVARCSWPVQTHSPAAARPSHRGGGPRSACRSEAHLQRKRRERTLPGFRPRKCNKPTSSRQYSFPSVTPAISVG